MADWTIHVDEKPFCFVPHSSAARQWAIDALPAAVTFDGGLYFAEDALAEQCEAMIKAEGFTIRTMKDSNDEG